MGLNMKAYSTEWMKNGDKSYDDEELWDYPLAAAQEIGEFLNSWGYSWWSKAPADKQNCLTELVDAWHFIVSQAIIESEGDLEDAATELLYGWARVYDAGVSSTHRNVTVEAKTLMLFLLSLRSRQESVTMRAVYSKFFKVLLSAGFSLDHFTARYNAKLQLNLFRQLNGYNTKPRQYQKLWGTDKLEDNYVLAAWIDGIFNDPEAKLPTEMAMMRWIAVQYTHHTGIKSVIPSDVDTTGIEE